MLTYITNSTIIRYTQCGKSINIEYIRSFKGEGHKALKKFINKFKGYEILCTISCDNKKSMILFLRNGFEIYLVNDNHINCRYVGCHITNKDILNKINNNQKPFSIDEKGIIFIKTKFKEFDHKYYDLIFLEDDEVSDE